MKAYRKLREISPINQGHRRKQVYRKNNFYASERRVVQGFALHPDLLYGLKVIAKQEKKSVCWLIETALTEYFGVDIMLRDCKVTRPARNIQDQILYERNREKANREKARK